jgi:hypothetical protein
MGVRLDSNVISSATSFRARSLETAVTPPAAPPKAPEAAAARPSAYQRDSFESSPATRQGMPALNVPSAPPAAAAGPQPVNEAEGAQAAQQWKLGDAAVAQLTDIDCGEAVLTQMKKALDESAAPGADAQKREEVRSSADAANRALLGRFQLNLKDGARPDEMGAVLGSMGIAVTHSMANYDPIAISEGLKAGQLGMAMVDSNALANAGLPADQQKQGPGALHWITIDGYNSGELSHDPMDDKLRVKDPIKGEYWVSAHDMLKAMDAARIQHTGTGGMMMVQNRPDMNTQEARDALARGNVDHMVRLGGGNGIGVKRLGASEPS